MSTPTILFTIYLSIGLVLMTVAIASDKKRERTKGYGSEDAGGHEVVTALAIFIALLWPFWLLSLLTKKSPKE